MTTQSQQLLELDDSSTETRPVTSIPGIGAATADELHDKHGVNTVTQFTDRVFNDGDVYILQSIRNTDRVAQWMTDVAAVLPVDARPVKIFAYLLTRTVSTSDSAFTVTDVATRDPSLRDTDQWRNAYWVRRDAVTAVGSCKYALQPLRHAVGEFTENESVTVNDDAGVVTYRHANGAETRVTRAYVNRLQDLFDFTVSDGEVHRMGGVGVGYRDVETGVYVVVASRNGVIRESKRPCYVQRLVDA